MECGRGVEGFRSTRGSGPRGGTPLEMTCKVGSVLAKP